MKYRTGALLLAVCLMLSGCGRVDQAAFAPEEKDRLTVFTCHQQSVYEPVIREFEARTGIWVEVESGTAQDLRTAAEEAGVDVIFGGSRDQLAGAEWNPFSSRPLVLIYNTKLVRMNLPQGWESLTEDPWKGKVAFPDPASQEGLLALSMLVQTGGSMEALAENLDGRLPGDSGEVVSAVAEGSFYIGVALEETALAAMDAGLDIAIVTPSEGTTALMDGAALVPGCAHEANGELFTSFLQGQDIQEMLESELHRRPAGETFEELTVDPERIFSQWQGLWKEAAP